MTGFTAEEGEAFDLGMHAAQSAMAAMARVIETAAPHVAIPVALLAHAYVLYKLRAIAKEMNKVHPDYEQDMLALARKIEEADLPQFEKFAAEKRKEFGFKTVA